MRDKLIRALSAFGLKRMAVAVVGTDSEDPEAIAATMAEKVEDEVKDRLERHPLMHACAAAGIATPEQLSAVLDSKKLGDEYLAELRQDAQDQAIRAYGPEAGPAIAAPVNSLPASTVKVLRDGWRKEADEKFRQGPNGEPGVRQTAPQASAATARDADEPETPKPQLPETGRLVASALGIKPDDLAAATVAKNGAGKGGH